MSRLTESFLPHLPDEIRKPRYKRHTQGTGIIHLGVGAFHRAHQAAYTEAALNQSGGDWRILGASLASNTAAEQLLPQDGLYTLVEKRPSGPTFQIIGALAGVIQANQQPQALIDAISLETTRIVSMTVTEKGYGYEANTGNLDQSHPSISADLKLPDQPTSTIGFLVAGLRARRAAGQSGLTLISCDNVPANGEMLRRLTLQFAHQLDPTLADWIDQNVSFPSTMVDRITPATTTEDLAVVENRLGVSDRGAVVCEPFSQWVIEDKFFEGHRPNWEAGGAQFVENVAPYEEMKLRLLNGSHSLLAYLGCLSGTAYIHQLMAMPAYREIIVRLMNESAETLQVPDGFNLTEYRGQLLNRFENPSIQHKTAQIAMDGSQKLPQRIVAPAMHRLSAGRSIDVLALTIAAWMRFVMSSAENLIIDPLASELLEIRAKHSNNREDFVNALLHQNKIFPEHIAGDRKFSEPIKSSFHKLCTQGVEATIKETLR